MVGSMDTSFRALYQGRLGHACYNFSKEFEILLE